MFHQFNAANLNQPAIAVWGQVLVGATFGLVVTAPAQAFNFTTGEVGGSCESLLSVSSAYSQALGSEKLPTCETADGFRLVATGGKLQTKRQDAITNVGVTDFDWSGLAGICMIGVISPCNGNTGEGEIGDSEAISLGLPQGNAVLDTLDLSFRWSWGTPAQVTFDLVALLTDQTQTKGTLTFIQNNEAVWNWQGQTQTIKLGDTGYRLLNPFANTAIAAVKLTAPDLSKIRKRPAPISLYPDPNYQPVDQYDYIDTKYGLVGATIKTQKSVPEPSTIAGLCLLAVWGILRRR
jgi:hypothetical protein